MPPRKTSKFLFVGIAAGIAVAIIVAAVVLYPAIGTSSNCTPSPPSALKNAQVQELVSCHTSVSLGPTSYQSYAMPRLSDDETTVGQYTVTQSGNLTVQTFLVNGSQLGQLIVNPHPSTPPAAPFWSSGLVHICNVSVDDGPSPGQYFLVIENLGGTAATVEWTQSLVLYYVPTPIA
jgi:hypothetical protein